MLIRCRYTRVQIYHTSARKIKCTKYLVWLLLYFLFKADDWNFVVYSKDPKLKTFFYFSKFLFVAETQRFKVTSRLSTKADFSGVDISGSIGYRNKGQVFCISLGPVTICVAIGIIGLLYLFSIQSDILNAWYRSAPRPIIE